MTMFTKFSRINDNKWLILINTYYCSIFMYLFVFSTSCYKTVPIGDGHIIPKRHKGFASI